MTGKLVTKKSPASLTAIQGSSAGVDALVVAGVLKQQRRGNLGHILGARLRQASR
jgi:hypothetical protein